MQLSMRLRDTVGVAHYTMGCLGVPGALGAAPDDASVFIIPGGCIEQHLIIIVI